MKVVEEWERSGLLPSFGRLGGNRMFRWDDFNVATPEAVNCDVIIVGTGMGGCTAGLALARAGLKVLFLERGEPARPPGPASPHPGHRPNVIRLESGGKRVDVCLPLGSGPGGSSAIYGAALQRFRRADFDGPCSAPADAWLPTSWPVAYDEFRKYYAEAEAWLEVCGTVDPGDADDDAKLRPPPSLSPRDEHFFQSFAALGLAPYRQHVGIRYAPGCTECAGMICPRDCKADGADRALKPALSRHGAKVAFNCTVERLIAADGEIRGVAGRVGGREFTARAGIVILAAGAIFTPLLLLHSTSAQYPNGIGNANDLVGRGLMFHVSDIMALWPSRKLSAAGPMKTLSTRAFYTIDGRKAGEFQSLGVLLTRQYLSDMLLRRIARVLPFAARRLALPVSLAVRLAFRPFRGATLFATILEDFPYRDNRVLPDKSAPSGLRLVYERSGELQDRIALMRRAITARLAPHRPLIVSGPDNLNFAHASGTCRFGDDPATSVLDKNNRVHDMNNLYVVDASFFPSSAGTNPSLTIAANALRVAEKIRERFKTKR